MRALILTCSTGQGHNAAAEAVSEAFARRGVDCQTRDALSFLGERASEVITDAFVELAVKSPRAFGLMYGAGEKLSELLPERVKSPVYLMNALYAQNLAKYLRENHVDIAVCPHLFPAEALTRLKREGACPARCCFVSTDYTCIPFLEETDMDAVTVPDAALLPAFTAHGLAAKRLHATGIPVSTAFGESTPKAQARKALSLPEGMPVFLVMTGGEGCGNAAALTNGLLARLGGQDARVIVLTGRNEQLRQKLAEAFCGDARVLAQGFTRRVPLYMDACDVLLSKPGGISSTEAAVKGVPLIHTAPIPGCETLTRSSFPSAGCPFSRPTRTPRPATPCALPLTRGSGGVWWRRSASISIRGRRNIFAI